MPDYTTSYVFRLDVEGEQAVNKARQLKQQIRDALGGATGMTQPGVDASHIQEVNSNLVKMLANLQDIAEASERTAEAMERGMRRARQATRATTEELQTGVMGIINRVNEVTNQATLQYFGLRRLGYGIAYMGTSLRMFGEQIEEVMTKAREEYLEFSEAVRGAGVAAGMPPELLAHLEQATHDLAKTYGYFTAQEAAQGLQRWQESTGIQIQSTEELTAALEDLVTVQELARIHTDQLGQTAENMGAVMKAWGLSLDDTEQVAQTLNYVATKTHTSLAELSQGMIQGAEVAKQSNTTFNEQAAILAVASDKGFRMVTTNAQLTLMMRKMLDPTKEYNEAMNRVLSNQLKMGQQWQDIVFPEGQFIGWPKMFDLLAASLEGYRGTQDRTISEAIKLVSSVRQGASVVHALVLEQMEARELGVNAFEAYAGAYEGILTAEEEAYLRTKENLVDATGAVQNAVMLYETQLSALDSSTSTYAAKIKAEFDEVSKTFGKAFTEPSLELQRRLLPILQFLSDFVERNRGVGSMLSTMGLLGKVAGTPIEGIGRTVGSATNLFILGTAVRNFMLATQQFQAAVLKFSGSVATDIPKGQSIGSKLGTALLTFGAALVLEQHVEASLRTLAKEWEQWPETRERARALAEQQSTWDRQAAAQMLVHSEMGKQLINEYFDERGVLGTLLAPWVSIQQAVRKLEYGLMERVARSHLGIEQPRHTAPPLPPEEQYHTAIAAVTKTQERATDLYPTAPTSEYLIPTPTEEAMVDTWDRHLTRIRDIEETHREQSQQMWDDLAEAKARIQRDLGRRLEDIARDYARSEARYEEDYLLRRAKTLERYAEIDKDQRDDELRRVADHQKRLADLERQHHNRMIDLLEARDVQGLVKEMRDYKDRKAQLTRDTADQRAQRAQQYEERRADLDRQVAEQDAEFERQRARRAEDYELRRAEERERAALSLADLEEEHAKRIATLERNKAKELEVLAQATTEELKNILNIETEEGASFARRLQNAERFLQMRELMMAQAEVGRLALEAEMDPAFVAQQRVPSRVLVQPIVHMGGVTVSADVDAEKLDAMQQASADMALNAVVQMYERITNLGVFAR